MSTDYYARFRITVTHGTTETLLSRTLLCQRSELKAQLQTILDEMEADSATVEKEHPLNVQSMRWKKLPLRYFRSGAWTPEGEMDPRKR